MLILRVLLLSKANIQLLTGPKLPHEITKSSMVTSPNGKEVRLLGGQTLKTTYSSLIFVLRNNGTQWEQSEQSLNFGRYSHLALPYTILNHNGCSKYRASDDDALPLNRDSYISPDLV